jgi:hypothetical protein
MRTEMTAVRGVFHDRDKLDDAVYRLGQFRVPTDSIRVHVVDAGGTQKREMGIEQEAGTLRGALIGAGAGAAIGLAIIVLAQAFVFGPGSSAPIDRGFIYMALGVVVSLALGGLPLGAVLAMGRWHIGERVTDEELRTGAAWVVVESDEMAEVARRVLGEAGAERVAG